MTKHAPSKIFTFQKINKMLFLFVVLITMSCSKEDSPEEPTLPVVTVGVITGSVNNGSTNLEGAKVTLKQTGQQDKSIVTGVDGTFKFENIPAGNVTLVTSLVLYAEQNTQAVIEAGKEVNLSISMTGDATVLTLIPDAKFEELLINAGYDVAPINGSVPTYKISTVKYLNFNDSGVADLTGLQDFAALENFSCSNIYGTSVIKLTSVDFSKNKALKSLDISFNKISTLDVSKNTALENLKMSSNLISNIDVSNNTALKLLFCDRNPLSALDVTKNTALTDLSFGVDITAIDISKNTALINVYAQNGKLTSLDVSKNTSLEILWVSDNQLTTLDISKNTALVHLMCQNNTLTTLDLNTNTALTGIVCSYNKLTSLDVSKCTELLRLDCRNNTLMSLDVSKNVKLVGLNLSYNNLTTLDLSKNPLIATIEGDYLFCDNNLLSTLNLKNGNNSKFTNGNFKTNTSTLKIVVDDVNYANTNWKNLKDASAVYVNSL